MPISLNVEGGRYEFEDGYKLRAWVFEQVEAGNEELAGKVLRAYKEQQRKASSGLKDWSGDFEVIGYDEQTDSYTLRLYAHNLEDGEKYLARFTLDKGKRTINFHRLGKSNK
jgi:hypothetical protein